MKSSCALDDVHTRLNSAHALWHEALSAYHDPARFRTFLNSCIQELRNVTFILQKNKSGIPDFEGWYAQWQERMKADPIMRWVVNARNQVVKEGELQTKSLARAYVKASYEEPPSFELDVDPLLSLEDIAGMIVSQDHPERIKKHGTVVVERIWRVNDLEHFEVLDALGHVFGVLVELVADAHVQSGLERGEASSCMAFDYDGIHSISQVAGWRPACMVEANMARSIAIRMADLMTTESTTRHFYPSEEDRETAIERYGDWPDLTKNGVLPPAEKAIVFFDKAKVMFLTDGHHLPFVFLFSTDRQYQIVSLHAADQAEKYLVMQELRRQMEIHNAEAVFMIGEIWSSQTRAPDNLIHLEVPEESADRQEWLMLTYADDTDRVFALGCEILRTDDGISLGPQQTFDPKTILFLRTVRSFWQEKEKDEGKARE